MFYGGGGGFFFISTKNELRVSNYTMGRCRESLTGSWEQTHSLLCLHPAGLKQSLTLATKKFRGKGSFPTKGQQIQNVAGPELSVSNAAEESGV